MTKTENNILLSKVSKTFLGTDKIPDKSILTPISRIYNEIGGRYEHKEENHGWWCDFTYKTKNKQEVMVVLTHQGNTIVDPVLIMNDNCRYVMFLGYCGGLHPDMEIGDITIATESYFENKDKYYKPKTDLSEVKSIFPDSFPGTNITVESVIREAIAINSKRPSYLKEGTVSADQETAYLYRESTSPIASVMIVSDLPSEKPLYEPHSSLDRKQFSNGVKKLVDGALEFIDSF